MATTQGQQRVVGSTESIEEAQASYSARVVPVTLQQLDRRAKFRWRSVTVDLGPVAISTQEYGAAFEGASAESPEVHTISFPLTSVQGEAAFAGTTLPVTRGRSTYLYSASGSAAFRYGTDYRGVQLSIRTSELTATLGALLGEALGAPCRFEPRLALDRGVGPALERAAGFAHAEAAVDDGLFSSPVAAQRFGEALLIRLLQGHAHNYSERLAKIERPADPRSVRLATEYLNANLGRAVRIAELAAVAGVSARALQIGFKKHRSCTPAQFVRDRRLTLARARLLEEGSGASIAAVARHCGFTHLGRFSAHYRALFHELPAQTRARGR